MYVGTQVGARNDADFEQWAQLGVVNVCSDPPGDARTWTKDDLARHREKLDSYGITLDMVQIPLSSTPLDTSQSPNVMLGKSPERAVTLETPVVGASTLRNHSGRKLRLTPLLWKASSST